MGLELPVGVPVGVGVVLGEPDGQMEGVCVAGSVGLGDGVPLGVV